MTFQSAWCAAAIRLFSAGAFVIALSGIAIATTLRCTMDAVGREGHVAPQITVKTSDSGRARISDAVVSSTGADYVIGNVVEETPTRLIFHWRLTNVSIGQSAANRAQPTLLSRLVVRRDTGAAVLTTEELRLTRTNRSARSTGTCTIED